MKTKNKTRNIKPKFSRSKKKKKEKRKKSRRGGGI